MSRSSSGKAPSAVREPLGESAPLARELAVRYCDQSDPDSSCLLYHSAWQYFRLIGLIGTIATDDDFLVPALEGLAATAQFDRILISGSADYGMLARLIHAFHTAGRDPHVTLVDICRTPLELNRWLAQRESAHFEAVQSDILEFVPKAPFDLICTHSFIGRFHGRRTALIRAWRDLLRAGGHVITTARIRPGRPENVRFSPREVEDFSCRALELARDCRELGPVKPESVAQWAREYAVRKINYPLISSEQLAGYFKKGGLHIDTLDRASTQSDRPSGPSMGIYSERIRIIAVRP